MSTTFKQCLTTKGIVADCDISGSRKGRYEIQFINSQTNEEDYVTFDVIGAGTKSGNEEAETLFKDFCKTEGIRQNTVTEIHVTKSEDCNMDVKKSNSISVPLLRSRNAGGRRMTLNESIKHAEKVAEKNEKKASWFWRKEGNPNYENCVKCAEKYRQLAEWFKELKHLREQTRWIPISEGLPKVTGWYYVTFETYSGGYMVREMFYRKPENYWTDTNANNSRKVLSNDDVVAWMPTRMPEPEPYKAESKSEEC